MRERELLINCLDKISEIHWHVDFSHSYDVTMSKVHRGQNKLENFGWRRCCPQPSAGQCEDSRRADK